MFSLAYISEAATAFDESALFELAELAGIKNKRLEVTGYLTYDDASELFFQFLEGPRASVEGLTSSIENDPRHRIISLVPILDEERLAAIQHTCADAVDRPQSAPGTSSQPNVMRLFPTWTMRLLTDGDFHRFDLNAELVEALVLMRNQSLGTAAPDAITRLSRKLTVRCHAMS